jgi:hypothetical protein
MRTCYIISTCDKYLETRVKYQMDTMLKNVDRQDIFYLTTKPNIENRQFGWYCMDDIQNITWKYIHFIYNMNILDYDWYIFIDDDTFVFKNRLETLLSLYNPNECYYIGKELDHIKNDYCIYMSGGAGYAISNGLYKLINNYLKNIGINNSYKHWCDDLCIGLWIQEIKKDNDVKQINNNLFNTGLQNDDSELKTAITIHKVITKELYDFYSSIDSDVKFIEENKVETVENIKTVFALVSDLNYFNKAKRTIIDLRSKGNWNGQIVLVTIDFDLNSNFKDFYNIIEVKFPSIDKTHLLANIGENGFNDTTDKREINKLNQWEKLHIFDDYFTKWERVVFLDAGLRVLDDVKYLLELDYKNRLIAPKDGKLYHDQSFNCQLSYDKPELIESLKNEFGENILKSNYMLNCMWIYDTNILKLCGKNELIEAMNKYTFCKTNEMGIMNIVFHFKYNLWEQFPIKASNNKILFDWCELNNPDTNWKDYCYIKYPLTISFNDC